MGVLPASMSVPHTQASGVLGSQRRHWTPGVGVMDDGWAPACGYWDLNSGPLFCLNETGSPYREPSALESRVPGRWVSSSTSAYNCAIYIYFAFYFFETHVAQSTTELTLPRMTLNLWSSCLHLLSARITDVYHHTQFSVVLEMKPRLHEWSPIPAKFQDLPLKERCSRRSMDKSAKQRTIRHLCHFFLQWWSQVGLCGGIHHSNSSDCRKCYLEKQ